MQRSGMIRLLVLFGCLSGITAAGYAAGPGFSTFLTPGNSMTPVARLYSYGGLDHGQARQQDAYLLVNRHSTDRKYVDNRPYVQLGVKIPTDGVYFVNFRASNGTAKLRHQSYGPVVREWDLRNEACNPCDYLVRLELSAGHHYFYFWSEDWYKYIYSASVESEK